MHPLEYFDRIYIINLPNRTDRRSEMSAQMRKIGLSLESPLVHVFAAIRPAEKGDFETIGTRGCFLSHLAVLESALLAKAKRILVLEDDLNFAPDFNSRIGAAIDTLRSEPWDLFYGGYRLLSGDLPGPGTPAVPPTVRLTTAHFLGFNTRALELVVPWLKLILTRKPGNPAGGPMHVDGAYIWLRDQNQLITRVAVPELGYQRPSRTDIHALRWFDRAPVLRELGQYWRTARNRFR